MFYLELTAGQCHDNYLNLDMCVQAFPEAGYEIPYMVCIRKNYIKYILYEKWFFFSQNEIACMALGGYTLRDDGDGSDSRKGRN